MSRVLNGLEHFEFDSDPVSDADSGIEGDFIAQWEDAPESERDVILDAYCAVSPPGGLLQKADRGVGISSPRSRSR